MGNPESTIIENTVSEMSTAEANLLPKVTWGSPGAEAANIITTRLQVQNAKSADIAAVYILRLTCDTGTISDGTEGTVISGNDTNDAIVQTNASGQFDLEVYSLTVGAVYIVAGVAQGSKPIDCSTTLTNTFA